MKNEIVYKPYKNEVLLSAILVFFAFVLSIICIYFKSENLIILIILIIFIILCIYESKQCYYRSKNIIKLNDKGLSLVKGNDIIKSYRWTELPYCYYKQYKGRRYVILSEKVLHEDIYSEDSFYDLLRKIEIKSNIHFDTAIVFPLEKYVAPEHISQFLESKVNINNLLE